MAEPLVDQALEIIREHLTVPVVSAEPLRAGRMTRKVRIELMDGRMLLVRFYPRGRETVATFEPQILKHLHRAGAMVPLPIISSARPGNAFLVYEMLQGVSLDTCIDRLSDAELDELAKSVAAELFILACIPVSGWGELVSVDRAGADDWPTFLHEVTSANFGASRPAWLPEALSALRRIAATRIEPVRATLVWTDISPDNIIVNEAGGFVGLIDFESVMALEREALPGYLDARYHGTRFQRCFADALTLWHGSPELIALYAVIRALRMLPYQNEPLLAGGARDPLDKLLPGLDQACHTVAKWGRITN